MFGIEKGTISDRSLTILLAATGLIATSGLALLGARLWTYGALSPDQTLDLALKQLVAGRPITAAELAESIDRDALAGSQSIIDGEAESESPPDGEPAMRADDEGAEKPPSEKQRLHDYLIALGNHARAAKADSTSERRQFLQDTILTLNEFSESDFPTGRLSEGLLTRGDSYEQLGEFPEAAESLQRALTLDPRLKRDHLIKLARSQLKSPGKGNEAIDSLRSFLANDSLSFNAIRDARVLLAEAYLEFKRFDDAEALIGLMRQVVIPPNLTDSEALDYREIVELTDCRMVLERLLNQASKEMRVTDTSIVIREPDEIASANSLIDRLKRLQREGTDSTIAEASLMAGTIYQALEQSELALNEFNAIRAQRPFSGTSLRGALKEMEQYAEEGRGIEVLQTTRYLMREVGGIQGFDASQLPYGQFRKRILGVMAKLRENTQYEPALAVAQSLQPLFQRGDTLKQQGLTYREWADDTSMRANEASDDPNSELNREARQLYRNAGVKFAGAAQQLFDDAEYTDLQWSAIENFQAGHHFERALRLLEEYTRYENRNRQARASLAFARSALATDRIDEAIERLEDCIIDHPRDPQIYEARWLLAMAYGEQEEFDKAEDLLLENLEGGILTPEAPTWRDSEFALGQILYRRATLEALRDRQPNAIARANPTNADPIPMGQRLTLATRSLKYLDDAAMNRYPTDKQAFPARYSAAKLRELASDWYAEASQETNLLESTRRDLMGRSTRMRDQSVAAYQGLRRELMNLEDERGLSAPEQKILRNTYFGIAQAHRDAGRYDKAAEYYQDCELRFASKPIVLEAIMGRAGCMLQLNRQKLAEQLIRKALDALQRIPDSSDPEFLATTRFGRDDWNRYLTWQMQHFNRRAKAEST
ncbi:MAG: tetratricopeptide repeat protein [Planctomycetota bacterium]